MRQTTLVLGLGDPARGDDGFGPAALAELRRLHGADPYVVPIETKGIDLRLLPVLAAVPHLLVLTTARLGAAPGTLHRLEWDGPADALGPRLPPIRASGIELLRMLHFWADPVPYLLVLGVEPTRPAAAGAMSAAVGKMIGPVVAAAGAELRRWGHGVMFEPETEPAPAMT